MACSSRVADNEAWLEIAERLIARFAEVAPREVAATVLDARAATDLFALPLPERLAIGERLAEERLLQRIGESNGAAAHLDPQTHRRRVQPGFAATGD